MSFFSDQNSCQVGQNPLNKVLQHNDNAAVERLHNLQSQNSHPNQILPIHDQRLQDEYNQFATSTEFQHPANDFQASQFNMRPGHGNQQVFATQQNNQWVSDFNRMSIIDNSMSIQPVTDQTKQRKASLYTQQSSQRVSRPITESIQSSFAPNQRTIPQYQQFSQSLSNTQVRDEEQVIHQSVSKEFDDVFSEIEAEIKNDITQEQQIVETKEDEERLEEQEKAEREPQTILDEDDKIKFAILAKSVFNLMNETPKHISSTTSNKFKQSGFMQLMNKISNREIEISNDKRKLVDQSGADIRSALPDPLSNINTILESSFDAAVRISAANNATTNADAWQSEFA